MNTRAIRLLLAPAAVALLVAVLSFLLIESRSVKNEYYLSHAERMRVLSATRGDINNFIDEAQSAYASGIALPAGALATLGQIESGSGLVRSLNDVPRVTPELESRVAEFAAAADEFVTWGQQYSDDQSELARRLVAVQEQSPALVRRLRDENLDLLAQQAFSLAIDVLEFASGEGVRVAAPLELRSNALRGAAAAPTEIATRLAAFADLTDQLMSAHAASAASLARMSAQPALTALAEVSEALENSNRQTVSRAERARNLLAGCAVLILLAAAYAVWRLQLSYRELNDINAGLEERVLERTDLLSKAYDDLKESQVQLIHAEKMSSLGEMVAGISHEINTPLWYLINNASVLQERLEVVGELCAVNDAMLTAVRSRTAVNEAVSKGLRKIDDLFQEGMRDDVEEAKSLVQDSIDGLEDLTQLAQGLKDFSRLDRAAQGEFDVNEGLERTLLIAKNHLKHKANVQTHFGDLPLIHCSPSQINQVFLNLLTNAADAIDSRGDIVIHTSAQDESVEISIADTGRGISAEIMSKIRDPFFTTKDVGQGTGLGLSIVDRIVAQHGGKLAIESEPGKGTTVSVTLPRAAPPGVDLDLGISGESGPHPSLSAAALAQQAAEINAANSGALPA